MKRFSLFILGIFLVYIIYYDFQIGTLSSVTTIAESKQVNSEVIQDGVTEPFFEVTVKQGDTVMSIIEKKHNRFPESIEKMVDDFESLNEGVKAEEILVGKTYLFPLYTN
ncbi:hypothetical protein ACNRWW_14450 [Metabacillus sp. HB246100]